MIYRLLLVCGLGFSLAACGADGQGTVRLQFQPAAFQSDEFSLGPTSVTQNDCVIPDNIATFQVRAFSALITDSSPSDYDIDDIDDNCALNILLPPNAAIELVVKAFDGDGNLVRKSIASIEPFEADTSIDFPTPLWPAKRIVDSSGGEGAATNLIYVEIMRQFDQFLLELAFDTVVFPATRGGSDSLNGFIELSNPDLERSYTMILDAPEQGLSVVDNDGGTPARAQFEFITGGIQIGLPYDVVGGENSEGPTISAPSIDFAITLLSNDDQVVDVLPETGTVSLN